MADLRILRHQYMEKLNDAIKLELEDYHFNFTWKSGWPPGWTDSIDDPVAVVDPIDQDPWHSPLTLVTFLKAYPNNGCLDDFDTKADTPMFKQFILDIVRKFVKTEKYPIEDKELWMDLRTGFYVDVKFDDNKKIDHIEITIRLKEK